MSQTQNATICHSVNLVKAVHTNLSQLFSPESGAKRVADILMLMVLRVIKFNKAQIPHRQEFK